MGSKMVYNFLGKDEKTWRNLLTLDQNIHSVYSPIRAVYPNKNHVTSHPEQHLEFLSLKRGCTGSSESTLVKMTRCHRGNSNVYQQHNVTVDKENYFDVYSLYNL